jgi:hypothetical protein
MMRLEIREGQWAEVRSFGAASLEKTITSFLGNRDVMTVGFEQCVLLRGIEIRLDHFRAHFLDGDFGSPSEFGFGLGRIAQQGFDFGRPEVTGVHFDDHITRFH